MALYHVCLVPVSRASRSLNIKTTDAIFRNAILKCSKMELLEIPHAKRRNDKFLMTFVCELEKAELSVIMFYVDARFR